MEIKNRVFTPGELEIISVANAMEERLVKALEDKEKREELIYELEAAFGECAYEPSERGAGIAFTEDVEEKIFHILDKFKVCFRED